MHTLGRREATAMAGGPAPGAPLTAKSSYRDVCDRGNIGDQSTTPGRGATSSRSRAVEGSRALHTRIRAREACQTKRSRRAMEQEDGNPSVAALGDRSVRPSVAATYADNTQQ